MEIIRIEELGCSSCLIMKSRMKELTTGKNKHWIDQEYENSKEVLKLYKIDDDILPIYIRKDNKTFLVGEKSKKEIEIFLGGE